MNLMILPITKAQDELLSLPEKLSKTNDTVSVTRGGKPVLAILPWEEYEAIVETIEILSDQRLMIRLRKSIREAKQGKLISWEQVKRKLSRNRA